MEARYYSSAQGRFTIPDWSAKEEPVPYAKLEDPQSLNLYGYVRNNPLSRFDVDGHCDSGGHPDLAGPCPPPPKTPDPAGVRQNISTTPNSQSQQKPAAGNQTQAAKPQQYTCGSQCHLSASAQLGIVQHDSDGNEGHNSLILPQVGAQGNVTAFAANPDQKVVATISGGLTKTLSASVDLVKNPDGTRGLANAQVSLGAAVPPYPVSVSIPIPTMSSMHSDPIPLSMQRSNEAFAAANPGFDDIR
jgi:RHS repeat-associated protein